MSKSKISSEDVHESPTKDPLFLSVIKLIEKCESSNGYRACYDCPKRKKCEGLFERLSDASAKNELDSKKARYFLEQFGRILL